MAPLECKEEASLLDIAFISELNLAGEVLRSAIAFGSRFGVHPHHFSIVLRELLKNAVVHGNKEDATQRVWCRIDASHPGTVAITVRDTGKGFNYRCLDLRLPEQAGGLEQRGYKLINAYADRIAFNEPGNEVTVFLRAAAEVPLRDAAGAR
jgi:anti-sigma regulatory factor (Ser/Thr protein kinase)